MNDEKAILALADRFFAAIERGDLDELRSIYAPDAVIWYNVSGGIETTAAESLKSFAALFARVRDRKYENRRLRAFAGGFVQQHLVTGTSADGTRVALAACVVVRVEGDRIVRLDEYVDSAAIAPWVA